MNGETSGGNAVTWKGKLERHRSSRCCRSRACPRTTAVRVHGPPDVLGRQRGRVVGRRELRHTGGADRGDLGTASGGGSSSSKTIAIIALVVGALGLAVGGAGLLAGRRTA